MLIIVPRALWGARRPKSIVPMQTPVSEVWAHHSASASPPDLPQAKDDIEKAGERAMMRGIQNYHMDTKGWADFAYSFAVCPSGRVYRGRGWKRQGAHTEGHNDHSVAICFMGNFEVERPTVQALEAARQLIAQGKRFKRFSSAVRVGGHRDASGAQTACPGAKLYQRIGEIG